MGKKRYSFEEMRFFLSGLGNLIFQFLEFYSEDLSKLQYPVF